MFDLDMLIPITFFVIIGYVIKSISDNRVRHRLIEKGLLDKNINILYAERLEGSYLSALKWGLLMVGLGMALLITQLFPEYISEEFTVGGMFIFAGAAFLIYYFIARNLISKNEILKE